MEIKGVTSNNNILQSSTIQNKNTYGSKDDFLKILAAQMQNQDPLEPVSDTDFIAQMTQFSMAEELTAINTNFDFLKGISLTGKDIYAKFSGEDFSGYVYGTVESVAMENGEIYAIVDQKPIKISDILEVYDSNIKEEDL